jgi:diguanylate cyclase (GGDEF)-like protein
MLVVRVFFQQTDDKNLSLYVYRMAVPVAVALVTLVLVFSHFYRSKMPIIRHFSSKTPFLAICIVFFTFLACFLDIKAGYQPILLLPAMLVLGFIYWSRIFFLLGTVMVAIAGVSSLSFFLTGTIAVDDVTIFFLAFVFSVSGARVIQRNVLPGEERMRSLEQENKELWDLSFKDPLTGLFNRRYMQQTAENLFSRAVRYREQLFILMIDIDHFKKVNDTHGHAVGDEVLKTIAATIQTFVRASDFVARYGGEEFIVFIVQSSAELTQNIANRIRDGVAAIHFEQVGWTVTVSIGIAGLQEGDTLESQIARSDEFLYISKKGGRNRVSGL